MNKAFLYEMLRTESVSGGEIPLQKKVAAYMREQGAEVETDLAGDVISSINSASPFRVLLCGHIDEIGFRVTHITDDGYLQVGKAGGIRLALAQGKRVTVLGRKRLTGVMGLLLRNGRGAHRHRADRSLHRLWLHQPGGGPGAGRPRGVSSPTPMPWTSWRTTASPAGGWTTAWAPIPCSTLCCGPGRRGRRWASLRPPPPERRPPCGATFHAAGRVRPTLAVAVDVIHYL